MKVPFMRSPYNYDRDVASDESGIDCPEPTLAQQQFKDEADINVILERFGRTGELIAPVRVPQYGDFSQVNDFHTAMNAVRAAQEGFDAMPASIRARFNNDAGRFVDFVMDDSNRDEAIKLGLIEVPPAEPAVVTPPQAE